MNEEANMVFTTVEYYSAKTWKEILTYAATWMNPEDIK